VSESVVADAGEKDPRHEKAGANPFSRLALFVRQVVAEMRRVVTPSRDEVVRYTIIVLVFVAIMMALIFAFDYAFSRGAAWVFGG